MCGRRADTFGTKTHFNADGVFADLSERTALLNKSKTWEDAFTQGDLAPFDQITKVQKSGTRLPEIGWGAC